MMNIILEFDCNSCSESYARFSGNTVGAALALARDANWTLHQDGNGDWHIRCPDCTARLDREQEERMGVDLS